MNLKKNLAVPGDTSPCTRVPRDKSEKKFRRKNPKIMKNVFFESVILAEVCRFKKKFKSKKSYLDEINSMTSSPGKQGRFCLRVLRDGFICCVWKGDTKGEISRSPHSTWSTGRSPLLGRGGTLQTPNFKLPTVMKLSLIF